jgi:oligopeptidase B
MIKPPICKKIPKDLKIHDHTRLDNYFWLNDRENPEVIKYLEEENAYTDSVMKDTEPLQEALYKEIKGRIKQEDNSVPFLFNGYYYYTRTIQETEYYLYCRKKGSLSSDEEILLDVNKMAEGHEFYQLGGVSVSPDNRWLAYSVDNVSRRLYTIYFKNLETDEVLKKTISNTSGGIAWCNDNRTIFFTRKNEKTLRAEKVFRTEIDTPDDSIEEVFYEADEAFHASVSRSKSGKYIIIDSESTLSSESRVLESDNPVGEFKIVHNREKDFLYSIEHFEKDFYVLTNWNAKNFRLMKTSVNNTGKENWKELIAHRKDVLLESFEIFKDFLVVEETKEGLNHIRVMPWDGEEHYLDFGEETYTAGVSVNREFDTDVLRYSYTSLTTPASTYDYDMNSRKKELMKQMEVVGGKFDPDNYQSHRLWAKSDDGTKIPVSIVFRKGLKKNGKNPLCITAYGSYGYSYPVGFSSTRLSLLDRGFVFAIAHIRGGQEMGRYWYEDGKLLKKKNTFNDFIDCTKYLQKEKYSSPKYTFAQGGSAGGLLMGAVVNSAAEIYKGIIADVPFVDVITTMLDESIPLTTGEFDEWGNPKDKKSYNYILSYSPYENVTSKYYPAMLITTGLHDSQVQYWEPAKWVAKLRDIKTDGNVLLLKTNMDFGHGGASGRFEWIKETALEYAFVFKMLGISDSLT